MQTRKLREEIQQKSILEIGAMKEPRALSLRAAGSLFTRRVQSEVDLIISDSLMVMRQIVCIHDAITDA